jgi:branched-chain amino acid transport system ATP-binding protein
VLSAHEITVRFGGITALDHVSLEVAPNEVLGVIGPNGAGKTTLFNVICGFVRAQSGSLTWRGEKLERISPSGLGRLGIARTLQSVGLFPGLNALENVIVGAERFRRSSLAGSLLGLPSWDRDERALEERARHALARVGCDEIAEDAPETLPFAMQKKVALARALVSEPDLLLLDEPAGGLGEDDLRDLRELIGALRGSMGVMLVEHHMDLVMSVCDRVVVLDFGRVLATGEPEAIQSDPQVLEAYLGRDASSAAQPATVGDGDARG